MDFRTKIAPTPSLIKYSLKTSFFTIGSCFSDTIGHRLSENKFNVSVNPFGTCYNPISIHKLLTFACKKTEPPINSYLEYNSIYSNYFFHSVFSSPTPAQVEHQVSSTIATACQSLHTTDIAIVTYGTAWVYQRKDIDEIVNNCHKVPAGNFNKRLLEVEHIVSDFDALMNELVLVNPNIRFIFTLSPVRHIKDTMELNSVSKAVLRQAIYIITERHKNTSYFPAYEIMMDDLRDYRFYKDDLIHPTAFAEDYIWEKFEQTYFNADTVAFIKKWKEIKSALAHKPFQPYSAAHQQFLKLLYTKVSELKNVVDVEEELSFIKSQITAI